MKNRSQFGRKEVIVGCFGMAIAFPFFLLVLYSFVGLAGAWQFDKQTFRLICICGAVAGLMFGIAAPRKAYQITKSVFSAF